jgi:hypothetical protein
VSSTKRRHASHPVTRLEVEVTFEIRSFCECCGSELDWCKRFVEIETPIELAHIKLWFESGAALGALRQLLRAGIPRMSYLKKLRSAKRHAGGQA